VVGSRKASAYGLDIARRFAKELAAAGLTVVSGLALGIDGAVHASALETGLTAAVLANGLDTIQPRTHLRLSEDILKHGGAIISESPPGTIPLPGLFPVRNRIIAGLSQATLIIEADIRSGSLITALAALEYNREVMAIPHPLYNPGGQGPHYLIQMGACLVTSISDILSNLGIVYSTTEKDKVYIPESVEEERIYTLLSFEPIHLDLLIQQSKLPAEKVNPLVVLMEMKGIIRHVGGNQYIKA
jgi:DNA processing protein